LVTYALEALYEEAAKFSAQWAAENGVTAAAAVTDNGVNSSAAPASTAANAAQTGPSTSNAAAVSSSAAGGIPGSQNVNQEAPPAAAAGAAVPSLFELMAQQVMQQWTSRELLASGVMTDFLLEELYASAGKVSGCAACCIHWPPAAAGDVTLISALANRN
jgi:hypothetical protein